MSDTDTQICCPRCGELSCLDPDSKECSDNCITRLQRELAQARQDAERYCLVRRLNPNDFKRLWERNISENVPFDDLVDAARREGK